MNESKQRAGQKSKDVTFNKLPITELGVRARLRRQFVADPMLKERYYRWLEDYLLIKSTYATSDYRGIYKR